MISGRLVFNIALLWLLLVAPASAQQTRFDEFQKSVNKRSAEIWRFQKVLQDPDGRKQLAAVEWMLSSKDAALIRLAKEHGLFSSNPVLRQTTVRYILNSGPTLRLQGKGVGRENAALRHISFMGGTHNNGAGFFTFKINRYNPDTARWAIGGDNDASHNYLRLAGTSLTYVISYSNRNTAQATLELGPDGVMRGILFAYDAKIQVAIDLKE